MLGAAVILTKSYLFWITQYIISHLTVTLTNFSSSQHLQVSLGGKIFIYLWRENITNATKFGFQIWLNSLHFMLNRTADKLFSGLRLLATKHISITLINECSTPKNKMWIRFK